MVKHLGAFLLYHNNFGSNSQSYPEDGDYSAFWVQRFLWQGEDLQLSNLLMFTVLNNGTYIFNSSSLILLSHSICGIFQEILEDNLSAHVWIRGSGEKQRARREEASFVHAMLDHTIVHTAYAHIILGSVFLIRRQQLLSLLFWSQLYDLWHIETSLFFLIN